MQRSEGVSWGGSYLEAENPVEGPLVSESLPRGELLRRSSQQGIPMRGFACVSCRDPDDVCYAAGS